VPSRSQKRSGPTGGLLIGCPFDVGYQRKSDPVLLSRVRSVFFEDEYSGNILCKFKSETEVAEHSALLFPPWHFESAEITRRLIDGKEISSPFAFVWPKPITQCLA